MKASDTRIPDMEGELTDVIKDLAYNKEDPRKYFLAVQLCAEKLLKDKLYLTKLSVDFANNYAVSLEAVDKKPKGWDCSFIKEGLLRICVGLSSKDLVMYAVTLRYGKRAIIEIGEDPELKLTALDFMKPKIDQKSIDYLAGTYVNA